jgi:hypothetical protein
MRPPKRTVSRVCRVQTVLSARQRDGMMHVLVVVPRARAQAVSASSLAAGEPMLEAVLDRGTQVFSS